MKLSRRRIQALQHRDIFRELRCSCVFSPGSAAHQAFQLRCGFWAGSAAALRCVVAGHGHGKVQRQENCVVISLLPAARARGAGPVLMARSRAKMFGIRSAEIVFRTGNGAIKRQLRCDNQVFSGRLSGLVRRVLVVTRSEM